MVATLAATIAGLLLTPLGTAAWSGAVHAASGSNTAGPRSVARSGSTSGATFTFSGAVHGTLHLSGASCRGVYAKPTGPITTFTSGLPTVNGYNVDLVFSGQLTGSKAYKWSVDLNSYGKKVGGTHTIGTKTPPETDPPHAFLGGLLASRPNSIVALEWIAKSGSFTTTLISQTRGGGTGSANIEFVPTKKANSSPPYFGKPGTGDIHMTGTWSCTGYRPNG